jgi:hypothetical protein
MSNNAQGPAENRGSGYTPAKSSRISITDLRELKELLKDSGLGKWVVLAGFGGLVELLRAFLDVARYVLKR